MYIYCFPWTVTNFLLVNVFSRVLDEYEVNTYVEYVHQEEPQAVPETLPISMGENTFLLDNVPQVRNKLDIVMNAIGECDGIPILMFHGPLCNFFRLIRW